MKRLFFVLLSVTLLSLTLFKSPINDIKREFKTKYLVVFVIDGPRYTETFGDSTCALIPRMGKELKKEGVLYTNFLNLGVTHTAPGHTAITTGVYQSLKNDGSKFPKNPSFFQYYRKQKNKDEKSCYIISSKGKLHVLANTTDKAWKDMYMPSKFCGPGGNDKDYVGDSYINGKLHEIYFKEKPTLCLVNMLGVDVAGHQNDWEGYKNALKLCDQYVYDFWRKIQNDPEMKDKTALLITNDHGRHPDGRKDGFKSHGDGCDGCRKISLLALGPDFKKNVTFCNPRDMLDISKTISYMFDFEMPTSNGKILDELFK